MLSEDTLYISHHDNIPADLVGDFVCQCRAVGLNPSVIPRSPAPYASLEDYIPTVIMIFVTKPFFEAFLTKAGEDFYQLFKKHLAAFVKRVSAHKITTISAGKHKASPNYEFSRMISIYSKASNGEKLKFLFHTGGDDSYFLESISALCDMLKNQQLSNPELRPAGGMYILIFDQTKKTWVYKKFSPENYKKLKN